jgi:hypothetical protein
MKLKCVTKTSDNAVYPTCCDKADSIRVMLHLIRLPYVRVPLSSVFLLLSGHLPGRTEEHHKNPQSELCQGFKIGNTHIKARIMLMTSLGINGAEGLDSTTKVFIVCTDIYMLNFQPTCTAAKQHTI